MKEEELDNYIHRDLTWLDFNYRVLQEAKDKSLPLLERVKFMAIYSSNLDEFFRVRVANHRNIMRASKKTKKELEFAPENILKEILKKVNRQQEEISNIFETQFIPELEQNGIRVLRRLDLNEEQKVFVEEYFNQYLLPFVQPVLLVEDKIKPFLNNASLYLAIHLRDKANDKVNYAIVKIPSDQLDRFIILPSSEEQFHDLILLDDIVRHCVKWIFPGFDIIDTYSIKLTRDAELYIDDEYSGDLIAKIKHSLNKRQVGPASRLVYDREMDKPFLKYLIKVFDLGEFDLLPEGRYHNNFDFFKFPDFGNKHLTNIAFPPLPYAELEGNDIFEAITANDHLLHVPYQSYEAVVNFFEQAAKDPNVTHIKIVQYRVAKISRIMNALLEAIRLGKHVSAFIEVKARFDEEANLKWGETLENAGVNVYYSIPGIKVHAKMAIVRRIEDSKPNIYAYMSTGNFHEDTAKIYSDVGIFTKDPRITNEVTRLFSFLETQKKPSHDFEHLLVGKFGMKEKLIQLIRNEVKNAKNGHEALIFLKLNSLQDPMMIDELYKASSAGVKIKLIIRGICSLQPGIPGLSENIEAISIVDRFLEHARILIFFNKGKRDIYISSADWMVRNLDHRIETVVPIYDEKIRETLLDLVRIQLSDNVKARLIHYEKNNNYKSDNDDLAIRSQTETYYYMKRLNESKVEEIPEIEED
ncbi:polyphosphate kinase 1 [Portibacter lacus]|uniref:Polyphosphate kinase n=1 Tax=Portibacter lacus TaxID=1099794 RepID=A0AA37SPE4_9BACT|nr:polyphosphate kinase 1 [Portibacter lacus]GLR16323.1 polyphosphate kinase [Portibacter lacus]